MNRSLKLLASIFLLSGTAYAAPTVATSQASASAQTMNNALRKMRTQHVTHLEEQLGERGLPNSVVKAPGKILHKAVQGPFKDRLELGLTSEPAITEGASTSIEARGNSASHTLVRTHISATTGNIDGVAPTQHIQSTTDNAPVTPIHAYKDPRSGIQLTESEVTQWKASGTSNHAQQVTGPAKVRTIQPLSPGLAFQNKKLPAGSHLVTTHTGDALTVNFDRDGANPSIQNPQDAKSVSYVLQPTTNGGFKHTKVDGQALEDLKASSPTRSFTVDHNGKVVDNAAPGYDQQALRSGGFVQ